MRKGRRKKLSPDYAPWGVQCENRKNTSATQKHIHDIATGEGESGPASSHLIPQPLIRRWSDPLDQASGSKRTEANGRGGGGNVCNVCRMGEERKSVTLHCTPGVYTSNSLAKATVGEPEKDKIVLSLGRVNIPIFAGYSLSILSIFDVPIDASLPSNTHLGPPCDISGPSSLDSNIKIGDKVRVKPSVVTPNHKWGAVNHKSIGVVKSRSTEFNTFYKSYNLWMLKEIIIVSLNACYHSEK